MLSPSGIKVKQVKRLKGNTTKLMTTSKEKNLCRSEMAQKYRTQATKICSLIFTEKIPEEKKNRFLREEIFIFQMNNS